MKRVMKISFYALTLIMISALIIITNPVLAETITVITSATVPNSPPVINDLNVVLNNEIVTITVIVNDVNGICDISNDTVRCYITDESNLKDSFENTTWLYNAPLSLTETIDASTALYMTQVELCNALQGGNYYVEVIASDNLGASDTELNYTSPDCFFTYSHHTGGNRFGHGGGGGNLINWLDVYTNPALTPISVSPTPTTHTDTDTAISNMPVTTPTASLPAPAEVSGSATPRTMNWALIIIGVIVWLIISVRLADIYRRKP